MMKAVIEEENSHTCVELAELFPVSDEISHREGVQAVQVATPHTVGNRQATTSNHQFLVAFSASKRTYI